MTAITSSGSKPAGGRPLSYRLMVWLECPLRLRVGALGERSFPAGLYIYTGSARKTMAARLRRHLRREKRLRWHVDYLLSAPGVQVLEVEILAETECEVNQASGGHVRVTGFGASDCRAGCGSHLRYQGPTPWASGNRETSFRPVAPGYRRS